MYIYTYRYVYIYIYIYTYIHTYRVIMKMKKRFYLKCFDVCLLQLRFSVLIHQIYIYIHYIIHIMYILYICVYICLYEILLTLGYEKKQQQIKYYEKSLDELILSRAAKNLKMVNFICLTGRVLKK